MMSLSLFSSNTEYDVDAMSILTNSRHTYNKSKLNFFVAVSIKSDNEMLSLPTKPNIWYPI